MTNNIYISKGNRKMENVLIFNLPAVVTCSCRTAMCESKCYAKKAERLYPQTLPARQRNLEESMKDSFVTNMVNKIRFMNKKGKHKYFRWHESGEFYHKEYFEKVLEIVKQIPEMTFLAFTKSVFVKDYLDIIPENLHMFYSVWPDTKPENIIYKLPLALAGNCSHLYDKEVFECKGKCNDCWICFTSRKDVHFRIH